MPRCNHRTCVDVDVSGAPTSPTTSPTTRSEERRAGKDWYGVDLGGRIVAFWFSYGRVLVLIWTRFSTHMDACKLDTWKN